MAFTIEFAPDAVNQLRSLRKRDRQIVVDAIAVQLTHEPDQPTTNRKPLDDNRIAPWELRMGDFRVFYDVNRDDQSVIIGGVGEKSHNRLQIGGEEIELSRLCHSKGTTMTVPELVELPRGEAVT